MKSRYTQQVPQCRRSRWWKNQWWNMTSSSSHGFCHHFQIWTWVTFFFFNTHCHLLPSLTKTEQSSPSTTRSEPATIIIFSNLTPTHTHPKPINLKPRNPRSQPQLERRTNPTKQQPPRSEKSGRKRRWTEINPQSHQPQANRSTAWLPWQRRTETRRRWRPSSLSVELRCGEAVGVPRWIRPRRRWRRVSRRWDAEVEGKGEEGEDEDGGGSQSDEWRCSRVLMMKWFWWWRCFDCF